MLKKLFLVTVVLLASAWSYFGKERQESHVPWQWDFKVYVEAARGNFDIQTGYGCTASVYKRWTAKLWYPFTLMDFEVAWHIWYTMTVAAYIFIALRLSGVRYGSVVAIVGLKFLMWNLHSGNVYVILAALCTVGPYPILLAGLVKPQLLGVGFLLAVQRGLAIRRLGREKSMGRHGRRSPVIPLLGEK